MQNLMFILLITLLSGCTYNIPSYQVRDKNLSLVKSGSKQIQVVQEKPSFDDDGSIVCRAAGPVKLPDGQTFSSYIATALKDELQSAGLLSGDADSKLHVKVKRVDFSSSLGATNWYIETDYLLDGQRFFVSTVYNDRSSYLGTKACNNMALYFRKAVAERLRQLYTKSEFKVAIGLTEKSKPISSVKNRLQQLKQLYQDDFITEEEYNQKRKALLNEI